MRWLSFFISATLWSIAHTLSSSGSRLLVINEDASEQDKYGQLWKDLRERGFAITYESPKSEGLALFKHGEREYDHLLVLPGKSKGLGPNLTPKILLDFVEMEGNILLTLSGESPTPSAIQSLLLEIDIALPADKTSLTVDHFHYDTLSSAEKHDVLLLPQPASTRSNVKHFFGGDGVLAFPRAVGQTLGNTSPLLQAIVKAPSTAYVYNPKDDAETVEEPFATGSQIALVSAMQARNSARFAVVGSAEALQDAWFNTKVKTPKGDSAKTANREFARQITQWTFKEVGVLKVGEIRHYQNSGETDPATGDLAKVGFTNPTIYRINSDVTFNIELSEYLTDHYGPPAIPSDDDFQLEFTMLSPYHRLPLKELHKTANSTIYTASFITPDQWGIFSFRVNYKRPFLTNIEVKKEVTVRHFAHDEYARSWTISGAWVWIAGIWVTIGGFVLFSGVWLYAEPIDKIVVKKKQ